MNTSLNRKYELTFLLASSFLVTLLNNLPYYYLFFDTTSKYKRPDLTVFEQFYNISWYTGQILISIVILSFFNYYIARYLLPRKSNQIISTLLLFIYNIVIAILLFRASFYLAYFTVGYPFSEEFAYKYYLWKFVYLTPSSLLIAYILDLIIRKRIVESNNAKLIEENLSNQLKTLKDQIKPHFLFNTLNTLSALIRNESRDVGLTFVDDLASVYRYILEKSNNDLVDIKDELEFAYSYIRILKKRFHNSFDNEILIPEKYFSYQIPPLTLQLLIENAIKHNEYSNDSPLHIKIVIDQNNIRVENNLKPKEDDSSGLGIGLQNLNQRYIILAKKEIIINNNDNKFIVRIPLIKK